MTIAKRIDKARLIAGRCGADHPVPAWVTLLLSRTGRLARGNTGATWICPAVPLIPSGKNDPAKRAMPAGRRAAA